MRYIVRTTGERVLDDSFSQINYGLSVDYEHKPTKAFINLLRQVQDENVVLMEDDIILCKDFDRRINEVINSNQNEIINFFTFPTSYITKYIIGPNAFCYNQCTYYPSSKIKEILNYVDNHKEVEEQPTPEPLLKTIFKGLNLITYTHRPCLVQHIDGGSLMGHIRPFSRRTPFFIDYLDELGIDYAVAWKTDNVHKLKQLLEEKFKDIK